MASATAISGARGAPEQSPVSLSWQQVVAALAAAAGGAAWVSAVGSAIAAIRLDRADLPIEPVVSVMSTEHRFAIGAGMLAAPLFVALLGFLADWIVTAQVPPVSPWVRLTVATVAIAFGFVLGLVLLKPQTWQYVCQVSAIVAVVLVFFFLDRGRDPRRWNERLLVFVLVLALAGFFALVFERTRTPEFDIAQATLIGDDLPPVTGYYATTTDSAVLLITFDASRCPAITGVPRDRIAELRIGPGRNAINPGASCRDAVEHPREVPGS